MCLKSSSTLSTNSRRCFETKRYKNALNQDKSIWREFDKSYHPTISPDIEE